MPCSKKLKHTLLFALCLGACAPPKGSKVSLGTPDGAKTVKVSVLVRGLLGAGLAIKLNGTGETAVGSDGITTFALGLDVGADYIVSVSRQPLLPVQLCSVVAGNGTAGIEDISDVVVECVTANFPLGGTTSGLVGGGLKLGISGQTLNVELNGSFTFALPVQDLTNYQVQVITQPTAPQQVCLVQNATGRIVGKASESVRVECRTSVQPAFDNGAGWNDYVTRGASLLETATDASACDAMSQSSYSGCLHGGEVRSLVLFGRESCAGVRATDTLNAFEWICGEPDPLDVTHSARVVSRGLLPGKALRDLIDAPSRTFKNNVVTVLDGAGATIAISASTPWWQTPIQSGDGALDAAGTIYLVSGATPQVVGADRVAVVGDLTSNLSVAGRSFVWLDGKVVAAAATHGVLVQDSRFVVLRGVNVEQATEANVRIVGGAANALFDVVSAASLRGIDLDTTSGLVVSRVVAVSNRQAGVRLSAVSASRLEQVQAIAGGTGGVGVALFGSSNNDFSTVRTNNNRGGGVLLSTSDHNRFMQLTSSNNLVSLVQLESSNGNWLSGVSAVLGPTGFVSTDSQGNVVEQVVTIANKRFLSCFTGSIVFHDQISFPSAPTGDCTTALDGPTGPTNNVSLQASFVGPVGINDAVNAIDMNGVASLASLEAVRLHWHSFRNTFRAWGPSTASSFLHDVQHTACVGGDCRIYDWSLATSTVDLLRGKFPAPLATDVRTHTWTNADATACSAIAGAVFSGTCTSTYLPHAIELSGDEVGNDNGLCESNERCAVAPNIASYQGHGPGLSSTIGMGGLVENITLISPANNDGTAP